MKRRPRILSGIGSVLSKVVCLGKGQANSVKSAVGDAPIVSNVSGKISNLLSAIGEVTSNSEISGKFDSIISAIGNSNIFSFVSGKISNIISTVGFAQGETMIVCDPGSGSTTPAQDFFNRITAAGGTAPNTTQQTAYSNFIDTAIADGWWNKCDVIYLMFTYNSVAARLNLKENNYNAVAGGSSVFTSLSGYAGNNTSAGAMDTGFNPSSPLAKQYSLNSAHIGAWVVTSTANADIAGGNFTRLRVNASGGVLGGSMNDLTTVTPAAAGRITDHCVMNRTSSSRIDRWVGGIKYSTSTTASSGMDNANFTICGNVGASAYSDERLGAFHCGSALSDVDILSIRAALKQFIIDIGSAVVYSYTLGEGVNAGTFGGPSGNMITQNAAKSWSYLRDGPKHRFEIRDGDVWALGDSGQFKNRSEIHNPNVWPDANESWYAFSFMWETGAASQGNCVWSQMHSPPSGGSPPIALAFYNNTQVMHAYTLPGAGVNSIGITPTRGVVHNLVTKFHISYSGAGYHQVWLDGVSVYSRTGINIGYDNQGNYFKFGLYRSWGTNMANTMAFNYWNVEFAQGTNALQSRIASPLPVY